MGLASALKPEFVAHQYMHVRVPVRTMMVETMSDLVIVCDKKNSCERHHENENSWKRPQEFTVFQVVVFFIMLSNPSSNWF